MAKVSAHQRKARSFIQQEEWSKALTELERLLEEDSSNPTLHNQIGDVCLRKEDIENACVHFERAVDLYAGVGLHNNAVALCKKIMRLRPARVEVRQRLARLRLEQGFRGEAVTYFSEYLDQVHLGDEEQAKRFEYVCREFVEVLADEAPIGQILEKLESEGRFTCALEVVRKLAQKAADGGDEAASGRYTQKIRSLRVLVERSGGHDPMTSWAPDQDDRTPAVPQDPEEETPALVQVDEPATTEPETIVLERNELEMEPIGPTAPQDPERPVADASSLPAEADVLDPGGLLEMEEPALDPPEDESAGEYELQEISFDEVQSLLEPTEGAADEPQTTEVSNEVEEHEPILDGPTNATPVTEPTPATSDWSDLRRAPVWVPGENDQANPNPQTEPGSHMQLDEVIDSFRDQMARALDGDGASRYDLGVAYFEMGLYNEALAEFEAASSSPDLEVRCLEMQASCLLEQGRHGEIIELLLPILAQKENLDHPELGLYYALGLAFEAIGDLDRSREQFEKVVRIDAAFKDVQARLERA